MTFNLYTLLAAILVGALAGAAGARTARSSALASVRAAIVVGMGASLAAIAGALLLIDFDWFAVIHVSYLILTLAVPLAAAILFGTSRSTSRLVRSALVLPVLALPLGLYSSYIEPFWLRVEVVTVPSVRPGPRIGVLADLQTTEIGDYENESITTLLAQEPDIVLLPGDFSQLDATLIDTRLPEFNAVLARLSREVEYVIAVNGNTDSVDLLRRMVEGTDVIVLDNEVIDLPFPELTVRIAGISLNGNDQRADLAIDRIATTEQGVFRILLSHQPDEVFRLDPPQTVDLVVAGHTHGGQVSLPFFGPPLTLSKVPRDVAAGGLHQLEGSWVYVSTGVGRERGRAPQMRFGARPSIGILDIGPR